MSRPRMAALGVVALACASRLSVAVALGDRLHFDDEAIYLDAAARLLGGEGFGDGYRNAPGYPVVLAVLALLAPAGVLGARVAQAIVTGAGAAVVMALARAVGGRRTALAAGLLYAVDPLLVVAGALLYPEAVTAVLLATAILVAMRGGAGRAVCVGLLVGAATLLRPVALVLVPVFAVWAGSQTIGSGGRRALGAALVLAGCGLALAPWTVRNYRLHGVVTPIALAGTHTAPVSRSDLRSRGVVRALLQQAREAPAAMATHVGREFLNFWELYPRRLTTDNAKRRAEIHARDPRLPTGQTFPAGLRDCVSAIASGGELVLAAIGVAAIWQRRRAAALFLLAVPLVFAAGYAPFIGKMRYRVPVVPVVLVFAAAGVARLMRPSPGRH